MHNLLEWGEKTFDWRLWTLECCHIVLLLFRVARCVTESRGHELISNSDSPAPTLSSSLLMPSRQASAQSNGDQPTWSSREKRLEGEKIEKKGQRQIEHSANFGTPQVKREIKKPTETELVLRLISFSYSQSVTHSIFTANQNSFNRLKYETHGPGLFAKTQCAWQPRGISDQKRQHRHNVGVNTKQLSSTSDFVTLDWRGWRDLCKIDVSIYVCSSCPRRWPRTTQTQWH